jgi:membrane-associated phospholipid phosphatase
MFDRCNVRKWHEEIMNGPRISSETKSDAAPSSDSVINFKSAILPIILLLAALAVFSWDHTVTDAVRTSSPDLNQNVKYLRSFVEYFRGFGKGDVLVMLAFLIGFCGFKQRAVAIICALVISGMLVLPLKLAVHRERPRGNSHVSFPSGDAASAASFAQVMATGTPILIPVAVVTVAAVSTGRILVLAHYVSDVLVGSALGLLAGIIGFNISGRYKVLMFRQRYFFLLFTLYVSGNAVFCAMAHSQNELSHFLEMYGPVIYTIVVGRLIFLFLKQRNKHVSSYGRAERDELP